MAEAPLAERHLADLHALAASHDVPSYRMLRRDELVRAIRERGGEDVAAEEGKEVAAEEGERARPEPPEAAEPEREEEKEEEVEQVTGVLEVTRRGFGFLRLSGLEPSEGDVYISASQIRRCELLPGDEVSGPARPPRRGERHPALVHVDLVNGEEPSEEERPGFEELTPVAPTRRLALGSPSTGSEDADRLLRAVDLLSPLALGQRVLVRAAPRSGRTTLLRGLARALAADPAEVEVMVLLVDERPEEATRWRDDVEDAQLAVATAEMGPDDQIATAELALARAKRRAEAGRDVVLIVDSLSRLAAAHDDPTPVKHLFGSGRELAEDGAGSLTVIATTIEDEEEDGALRAVLTTENALIRLDPELAAAGVVPALDPAECRAAGEDELREPEELAAVRGLRERLAGLDGPDAARTLGELIAEAKSNEELLGRL